MIGSFAAFLLMSRPKAQLAQIVPPHSGNFIYSLTVIMKPVRIIKAMNVDPL